MSKRELIDTGTDKRYVRRDDEGQFKESDDVGRSASSNTSEPCNHSQLQGIVLGIIPSYMFINAMQAVIKMTGD